MNISKKDWKLFRERLSGWQENYMEGLVKEYANFLNDDKKPASEKFWELEKRIKDDKRYPEVIMEMSKSEGFDAYGHPSELFKLGMERLGIVTKRKPAKVIDFAQYIENNRGTND